VGFESKILVLQQTKAIHASELSASGISYILPTHINTDVSKRDLQWYFRCSSLATVTKTFELKNIKLSTIEHLERWIVCTSSELNVTPGILL
jgi:hypothetical protein